MNQKKDESGSGLAAFQQLADMARAQGKESGLPHMSEIAELFIEAAGGVKAFVRLLYEEWRKATPGSIARLRILQILCSSWKYGNESDRRTTSLGDLSEEDLDREIVGLMKRGGGR